MHTYPQKEKSAPGCTPESAQKVINISKRIVSQHKNQGQFNKDRLLEPVAVLNLLGIKIGKKNPAGYWILCCPFHAGGQEKNPSLSLHAGTGHYICHACGIKGGDILAFYMAVTGLKFPEAAKNLGAWGEMK